MINSGDELTDDNLKDMMREVNTDKKGLRNATCLIKFYRSLNII